MAANAYESTPLSTPTRKPQRVSYDRTAVHAVLDEGLTCHVGFVVDGRPVVLPQVYVRDGERLLIHGSSGARALALAGAEPLPVCVTVTLVDGLVFARSGFNHSVNYRSVVVHGSAVPVTDAREKARLLDLLLESMARGRSAQVRPATARELAATAVLAIDLVEVSLKSRSGAAIDEPDDEGLPHWAGVLPLSVVAGEPEPSDGVTAPVPPAISGWTR